jgi:hypothetical protein
VCAGKADRQAVLTVRGAAAAAAANEVTLSILKSRWAFQRYIR